MTALIFAAMYGFVEAVKALVAADPDLAHLNMEVSVPRLWCIRDGGRESVCTHKIDRRDTYRSLPPLPSVTHTTYRPSNLPPIVYPSNVSQNEDGDTALANAIYGDKDGTKGCAECVAVLRAAGASRECQNQFLDLNT
jgi:hypothetical protein